MTKQLPALAGGIDLTSGAVREVAAMVSGEPYRGGQMRTGALTGGRSVTIAYLIDALADGLAAEAADPARAAWEDLQGTSHFYPALRNLGDAAAGVGAFRDLVKLCQYANGWAAAPQGDLSPHALSRLLTHGIEGVDHLVKAIPVAVGYYRQHPDGETLRSGEEMLELLRVTWELFDPHQALVSRLVADAGPGGMLGDMRQQLGRIGDALRESDPGTPEYSHRNYNGQVMLFDSGAVRVTFDSQAPDRLMTGCNHDAYARFMTAVRRDDLMTSSGIYYGGQANSYTILAGADPATVIAAIVSSGLVSETEGARLLPRLAGIADRAARQRTAAGTAAPRGAVEPHTAL